MRAERSNGAGEARGYARPPAMSEPLASSGAATRRPGAAPARAGSRCAARRCADAGRRGEPHAARCCGSAPAATTPPFSLAVTGDRRASRASTSSSRGATPRDRGLEIEWVRFRWPTLLRDLEAGPLRRRDVGRHGAARALGRGQLQRAARRDRRRRAGRATRRASRRRARSTASACASPSTRGGHLERVARAALPARDRDRGGGERRRAARARSEGAVDAAITDTAEASVWQSELPDLVALGPFTRDRKAFLVAAGAAARAADLDAWLLGREADGTLDALRTRVSRRRARARASPSRCRRWSRRSTSGSR